MGKDSSVRERRKKELNRDDSRHGKDRPHERLQFRIGDFF